MAIAPLHGSVMRGAEGLTLFLLEQGAALSHVNERGWSPLTITQGVFYGNLGRRFPGTRNSITGPWCDVATSTRITEIDDTWLLLMVVWPRSRS